MPHPNATRYLTLADRLLPGRITGFYLVGSAALGAFRPHRSDLDFVALTSGEVNARALHYARMLLGFPTVNGVFVHQDDVARPVTTIRPLASSTGLHYRPGRAST